MYHGVGLESNLSTEEFEKQIKQIKNMNTYKFEEIQELNYLIPRKSILLTFDDGYRNNYTNAYPILKNIIRKLLYF